MDVREVKAVNSPQNIPKKSISSEPAIPSKAHQTSELQSAKMQSVTVEIHAGKHASSEAMANLNEAIGVINVASKTVDEIDSYVRGIMGIVEQASEQGIPEPRVGILENEANQLVRAVRDAIKVEAPNGVHPLQGEPYKAELEQTLGKTLEVLLPDLSKDELGLGQIQLTTKDFIVSTRAVVMRSQERVQQLRQALQILTTTIKDTANEVDVAMQNVEASNPSLREVERALSFAGETGLHITKNPKEALGSVGTLSPYSLGLLRQNS